MGKKAYIYSYTNKNTGKIYIGSRYSFKGRPEDDFNKKYFSSCIQKEFLDDLHNNNLIPNIICILDQDWYPNKDLCKIIVDVEGQFIQAVWKQFGKENSYNKHDRRHFVSYKCGPDNPVYGKHWKQSEEVIKKKSQRLMGHYTSDETKQKISTTLKNYWNEERRKEHSEKCKGRVRSEEAKRKTSETLKQGYKDGRIKSTRTGKPGTMLGKHLTEEQKQKLKKNHWSKNPETAQKVKQKLRKKSRFLTPEGEIVYMKKFIAKRYHKDWKLIE